MEVVTTDVLVIGGGVAGLSTAIVAREKGLDVLLCSKTAPGLANSSALSAGGFRSQNSSFSAEDHRRLTLETGHNLNEQVLVDTLVENAHQSIMSLRWYGVTVKERAMGFYVPAKEKGPAGLCLTRPMADYARSAGVRFLYPFQACEIIRGKDKALGVWGLQGYNNKSLAIEAKAVVLATGGGGATFLRTDNPLNTTGDGFCLAYRAGLPLMDMEFIQFYPMATFGTGQAGGNLLPILADVGRFVNCDGENLVEKYHINKLPLAISSRDQLSRALAREVALGKGVGGGIVLEFNVTDKDWERAGKLWGYDEDHLKGIKSKADRLLAGKKHLLVMPTAHFVMGGVAADSWGQTDIPGLLVAGEVAGGLHGANRMGGNALTEAVVFGIRAGQKALDLVNKKKSTISGLGKVAALAQKGMDKAVEKYVGSSGKRDISLIEFKKNIRRLLWNNAGILRTESLLLKAEQELNRCQKDLAYINIAAGNELAGFLEIENMLIMSRMIVKSALQRQESRGSHFRADFTATDNDNWQKHILIKKKGKNMDLLLCNTGFITSPQ